MADRTTVFSLRAARDSARQRFDGGLQQIKSDMEVSSIGSRLADKLQSDARAAGSYALDVIEANKGVVGGTLAALGVWFFREPITAWIETHFGDFGSPKDTSPEFEDMTDEQAD